MQVHPHPRHRHLQEVAKIKREVNIVHFGQKNYEVGKLSQNNISSRLSVHGKAYLISDFNSIVLDQYLDTHPLITNSQGV